MTHTKHSSRLASQLRRTLVACSLAVAVTQTSFTPSLLAASQDGATLVHPSNTSNLAVEVSKGTLVRLDRPANEVFIVDPEIADIQVKSPRLIYIFGKAAGETSFYAVDEKDEVIFSSAVTVTRSLTLLRETLKEMLPDLQIEARSIGQLVLLKGYASSPAEAATADQLARQLIGDTNVINQLTVLSPTQVNLRVRFAEVSRTVLKELGVSWESFYADSSFGVGLANGRNVFDVVADPITGLPLKQFVQPDSAGSLFGDILTGGLDLNYAIDALDNEGFLTVLAEPNLTALSGETANFLAGGEFPIPIPSRDGLGIEFREFGVSLEFTPTVLDSGRINMKVVPEVSDLSTAGAIRVDDISIPSISTRRAETTVELGSGQSFAIAGLLQNQILQDTTKFPGLGDIPIIGALFRSESFRR